MVMSNFLFIVLKTVKRKQRRRYIMFPVSVTLVLVVRLMKKLQISWKVYLILTSIHLICDCLYSVYLQFAYFWQLIKNSSSYRELMFALYHPVCCFFVGHCATYISLTKKK